jgi:DNA adenine methylase
VPFLKWPGGKRWASQLITSLLGQPISGTYYEPFLGGGAVFFSLRPKRAVLSDTNADLINTYRKVRDYPTDVLRRLKRLNVDEATYYRIRRTDPKDPLERAVRFLYLNRTAFGGIYRLNSEGKFNVPYGGGERSHEALWERRLVITASDALASARLRRADFEDVVALAGKGDAVYCDPTYTVAHENNGFVRFNESNFSWADQVRLAQATSRAAKRGATVIISNAYHTSIRHLYAGATFRRLERHSRVSADPSKRRLVKELLIRL